MKKEEIIGTMDKVLHELDEATDILIACIQTTSKEGDVETASSAAQLLYQAREFATHVARYKEYV